MPPSTAPSVRIVDEGVSQLSEDLEGIGDRLRTARMRSDISQRELARRLGLSPSMISQLERGISKPSVGTLYAIVTELGLSLDEVIRGRVTAEARPPGPASLQVIRRHERESIDLASGVRWEELISASDEGIDFILATYEVGGASAQDESMMRHHGREYGHVVSGVLGVRLGFEEYELGPGDSIAFDSTLPHLYFNKGDEPVESIWFIVGRSESTGSHVPSRVASGVER